MRRVMPRPSVENNSPPCRLRYASTESRPLDIDFTVHRFTARTPWSIGVFSTKPTKKSRESASMEQQMLQAGVPEPRRSQQHDDHKEAAGELGFGPQAHDPADLGEDQAGHGR